MSSHLTRQEALEVMRLIHQDTKGQSLTYATSNMGGTVFTTETLRQLSASQAQFPYGLHVQVFPFNSRKCVGVYHWPSSCLGSYQQERQVGYTLKCVYEDSTTVVATTGTNWLLARLAVFLHVTKKGVCYVTLHGSDGRYERHYSYDYVVSPR